MSDVQFLETFVSYSFCGFFWLFHSGVNLVRFTASWWEEVQSLKRLNLKILYRMED